MCSRDGEAQKRRRERETEHTIHRMFVCKFQGIDAMDAESHMNYEGNECVINAESSELAVARWKETTGMKD